MTVQGPVKKQQPDGMSHGGRGGTRRAPCDAPLLPSVGTIGGPSEEGGSQPNPRPPPPLHAK